MAATPAPTSSERPPYPSVIPPSLLILIIDLHPLSWSLLSNLQPPEDVPLKSGEGTIQKAQIGGITAGEFVTILMVFLNAHLAGRWGNRVVVYGASAGVSKLLYPTSQAGPSKPRPNTYHPFQLLNKQLEESIKQMAEEEERKWLAEGENNKLNESPALVSALTKALCYINRHIPSASQHTTHPTEGLATTGPEQTETRIMVVNATPGGPSSSNNESSNDSNGDINGRDGNNKGKGKAPGGMRGGYVGLMNCVFAAQKAKVPIDVLSLPPPSTNTSHPIFLQQAAYLTEGIYWRWNGRGGLLQYLHGIYLPPPTLRHTPFAVPPQDAVDFRAVCFCHHDIVDIGFVCSVCLSIFCKPLPVCQMCKTKFPIKSIPILESLTADLMPIPIPQTIPPPPIKPVKQPQQQKKKDNAEEPIVID